MRKTTLALSGLLAFCVIAPCIAAQSTVVPGQQRWDADHNGFPDAGVTVTGKYTSVYAYDANGGWYQDLGDGRVYGTVSSITDLDQATLTQCNYEVHYRGDFQNNAFLDTGWIINNIVCKGYDSPNKGTFNYLIVHRTDPRYQGNPDWAIWGDWEYHVSTQAGYGNLVRPYTAP